MPALLRALERLQRARLEHAGFEVRSVQSPLGALHLYDGPGGPDGDVPPVVLLHGIGSNATAYAPLLLRLRHDLANRVYAIDAPGHGFSEVPEPLPNPGGFFDAIADALDAAIDEPAILIGTSMGGALALRYAASRPGRVRGLFLCSPAGAPMSAPELAALREAFAMHTPADGAAFVERLFHRAPASRHLIGHLLRIRLLQPPVRTLLDAVGEDDFLTPGQAAALEMPIHLVWGQSEKLLPPSLLGWYRAHLPAHAVFEEPETYGHSAHLEHTDDLAARVVRFVGEVARATGGSTVRDRANAPGRRP